MERKKSLLVLTSSLSLNREQVQRQQRAMTLLHGQKIPYEIVDGADPSFKEQYVAEAQIL